MPDEKRETPKALAAFNEYCLLGTGRSLRKLADRLGQIEGKPRVRLATLETWSSSHHWQERVKSYDKEQFEEKQRRHNAEIEAMNERHVALAMEQQENAIRQIQALIEAQCFGSLASVQLLKLAIDLERLARGLPTERTEQQVNATGMVAVYLPQKLPIVEALKTDRSGTALGVMPVEDPDRP